MFYRIIARTVSFTAVASDEAAAMQIARALGDDRARVALVPEYASVEEAKAGFWQRFDDLEYADNVRFAFEDDAAEMEAYDEARANGCCGSVDHQMRIGERFAWMGCNHGH